MGVLIDERTRLQEDATIDQLVQVSQSLSVLLPCDPDQTVLSRLSPFSETRKISLNLKPNVLID